MTIHPINGSSFRPTPLSEVSKIKSSSIPASSKDSISIQKNEGPSFFYLAFLKISFPFRYLLSLLMRYQITRFLLKPFEFVYNLFTWAFDAVYYFIAKKFEVPQIQFTKEQLNQMQRKYWSLDREKWKEGVEAKYHNHGCNVFDLGLHGGSIEPGFNRNWERAVYFLSHQFQRKLDGKMYLELHKIACAHFLGNANDTLMDQDLVGVFRESEVKWNCSGSYLPTPEAQEELKAMNAEIRQKFGVFFAQFKPGEQGSIWLHYHALPREKVEAIYEYFCLNLHADLEKAKTEDEKFAAICKFYRNCEWLHSVKDGCGRCDLMVFNFLLTQNGFHPIISELPYLASTTSLANWIAYAKKSLKTWEQAQC